MTFHVHQLSVETKRGERTAPTVFSILTTSRLPSAAVATSAAAARRADAPLLPSPPLCARMLSCSVAVSVPEVSMDSSPCGGTQPHWRNAGNSCQTPPGVPALELSHPPIRLWTERHGAEDVQSEWREESHLCGYRKKKERVESERKVKSRDSSTFAYSSFSCWLDLFFFIVSTVVASTCCFFFLSGLIWKELRTFKHQESDPGGQRCAHSSSDFHLRVPTCLWSKWWCTFGWVTPLPPIRLAFMPLFLHISSTLDLLG